jgi:NosR/NirI family transcriptional regulator, nitrous oxide reductase regulator
LRRIAALLSFIALLSSVRVPLEPAPASHQPVYAQTPGAQNDPWGFDQEKTENWADILRPQALDLVLLIAFLTFALIGFFRKSVALKYVTLVVAVGYMGFFKSNLISIVNIFGVIDWNLPILKYNVVWYVFAIFTVASTVLWGRLYCGRICAYGAFTQLMDAVLPGKLRVEPPAWIERRAAWVKYGILATVVAYFIATKNLSVYRYVEPFWMFGLSETTGMWIGLGVLLIATVFVRNLYCRFLCPVGAALGLLSNLTVFRIKRWSECNTCKICEKTCEWGAIQGPKIIKSECVRCDDCERLYLDQKKCPHWIIILRKGDKSGKAVKLAPSPART